MVFGLCQNALYLGLNFVALQWIQASLASIIASSMPLIVALLVGENLSAETPARLSRSVQLAALSGVPAPPAGCASFYVVAARRNEPLFINAEKNARYPHNVDAMFLAELWRVPTINGFSTFNPPDWKFADPLAADYDARVMEYAQRHKLSGLCRLDVRQAQPWTRITG